MYFDDRLHSTIKLRWAPTTVLIIGVHAKGELWFLMAFMVHLTDRVGNHPFHIKGASTTCQLTFV